MSYSSFYKDLLQQSGGSWFDFEGLIRDIYVATLKPGDWAVDVGCHHGVHTFQMAQAVFPGGRVIAIEAAPAMADSLKSNMRNHYGHLSELIELECCGVAESDRTATFYFAPEVPGLSGLRRRDVLAAHRVEPFEVKITTLDQLCAHASGHIRFMKIDIEGGEYDALKGALKTIQRHQPLITFEHSRNTTSDFGYSIEQMLSLWSGLGYRLFDFFGNSYDAIQPWTDSMLSDYLAVPKSFKNPQRLFEVVRQTLATNGILVPLVEGTLR